MRDGMKKGINFDMLENVMKMTSFLCVASGGVSSIDDIKKDIVGIKEITNNTIEYLKSHRNSRVLFYEDLFGFFSGVKLNTEDNYKNIENWQELKTFYEQNKDFCHFEL